MGHAPDAPDDTMIAEPDAPESRGHLHRLGPAILLALSLTFLVSAAGMDFGSLSRPGPGFWPSVVAVITAGLSVVGLLLPRKEEEGFERRAVLRVGTLLIVLLAFPLVFGVVGFVVPSILLIIVMMRFLSQQSWLRSTIVAVTTTAVAYIVFAMLLDVRLPAFGS